MSEDAHTTTYQKVEYPSEADIVVNSLQQNFVSIINNSATAHLLDGNVIMVVGINPNVMPEVLVRFSQWIEEACSPDLVSRLDINVEYVDAQYYCLDVTVNEGGNE